MRVGVNCCFLAPHSGGINQYFSGLMNRLLDEAGEEYVLFHLPENTPLLESLVPQWREHAVCLASANQISSFLSDLDVYFCPGGKLAPRPVPVASVVTLVDVQEAWFPEFFTFRDRWYRFYHHPASTRLANRVITISEFSRQTIAAACGISPSKIDIAYLAPECSPAGDGTQVRIFPPSGLPERFLLYPAHFWKHKNHARLLQAIALARDELGVVLHCVLTGREVPHGYRPEAAIERHHLTGQVRVLGFQPEVLLRELYRRATALVFPSLFEGFGLPLVEAMAVGCPIVCSRTTSLPEVAGDAAVYFDPQDAAEMARVLIAIWTDADLRATLARNGRARVTRFNIDATAKVHRQAFELARQDFAERGPQTYSPSWDLLASGWRALRAVSLNRGGNRLNAKGH